MAVLQDADRAEGTAESMRVISMKRSPCASKKAAIREAYNTIDAFLNTNAATLNTQINTATAAIGEPNLSVEIKALILIDVVTRRYLKGV